MKVLKGLKEARLGALTRPLKCLMKLSKVLIKILKGLDKTTECLESLRVILFFGGQRGEKYLGRGSFGRPLRPLEAPEAAQVMLASDCD